MQETRNRKLPLEQGNLRAGLATGDGACTHLDVGVASGFALCIGPDGVPKQSLRSMTEVVSKMTLPQKQTNGKKLNDFPLKFF